MKSFLVSHKLKSSFLNLAGVASVPPGRVAGWGGVEWGGVGDLVGEEWYCCIFFLQHKMAWVAIRLVT